MTEASLFVTLPIGFTEEPKIFYLILFSAKEAACFESSLSYCFMCFTILWFVFNYKIIGSLVGGCDNIVQIYSIICLGADSNFSTFGIH